MTPTPALCSATTTQLAFFRSKPDLKDTPIKSLPAKTTVNLTGRLTGGAWVYGQALNTTGWLSMSGLNTTCNLNTLPVLGAAAKSIVPAPLLSLRAFTFSTDANNPNSCSDLPAGGLLIHTPARHQILFNATGVDITDDSTVILRATTNRTMTITVLEGFATVSLGANQQSATAGYELNVPLRNLRVSGPSSPPKPAQTADLALNTLCQLTSAAALTIPCDAKPTCTFSVQRFTADKNPVQLATNLSGAPICPPTTLFWEVDGVESVEFNGHNVPPHGAEEVCVTKTTTLTWFRNVRAIRKPCCIR